MAETDSEVQRGGLGLPPEPDAGLAGPARTVSEEEKSWGCLAHLSPLCGYVVPVPFANILAPFVVWKTKGDNLPFVAEQAKEALNFQITLFIAVLICIPLCFVFIGFILLPIVALAGLILTIMAAISANKGIGYRYPLTLRLVS